MQKNTVTNDSLNLGSFGIAGEPEAVAIKHEHTSYDGEEVYFTIGADCYVAFCDDYLGLSDITSAITSMKDNDKNITEVILLKPKEQNVTTPDDNHKSHTKDGSMLYVARIVYANN